MRVLQLLCFAMESYRVEIKTLVHTHAVIFQATTLMLLREIKSLDLLNPDPDRYSLFIFRSELGERY